MDKIGQKEATMSAPFIVHSLVSYTKYTKKYKKLTPVLFAATWRAPLDGFHLKVLGTAGGRACPSVGRLPTTRRAGSTMSSKLWWWWWFWLVWQTIMEALLRELFARLFYIWKTFTRFFPVVSTFFWCICRKNQKMISCDYLEKKMIGKS